MSRPTKLTPELQKEICGYIENGNSYTTAIQLAQISEPTFYEWKKRGEKDIKNKESTIFAEFFKAIKKARATCKAWHIQNITKSSAKQWQASAWFLERVWPNEFGKREKYEIKTQFDPIKVDIKFTKEQETEYQKRMAEFMGEGLEGE